ncbi:MAG TPA: VWA domain-containing protein [Planctomycetota bacterium]|nr:VWA domain-containing protein [Planctomycetota bacterium]
MFAEPLGLFALLAVPAVLALHGFRRRFRPREVSALFLWQSEAPSALAGRRRERVLRSPSLWLELAAALLLALAFAGPRLAAAARAEHLVVVLDGSASMGAVSGGESAHERARAIVGETIDALPRGSRATLIESGSRPRVLAGPAAFTAEALQHLESWRPSGARHDLGPALALAIELAAEGAITVVTDRFEPEAFPPQVEVIALGRPTDNLAITHAARSRELAGGVARDSAFLSVSSFAQVPRRATLVLKSDGRRLLEREIDLAPAERLQLALDLPPDTGLVEARLSGDALAIDDHAWLAPAPERTLALHSELAPEEARFLGLSGASGPIERWLELVPGSVAAGSSAAAHLVLAHAPSGGPSTWTLVFEPLGEGRKDLIGPFLAERGHRLLEGVTLDGIVWSADPALRLGGVPVVSAGNLPLLTDDERDGRRVLRLDLDPLRSSLQRSPDFPILLANWAELRRAELPGPERTNLALGESLSFRAGAGMEGPYVLQGPAGAASGAVRRELPPREHTVVDDLEEPGVYVLSSSGGRELARFAVSFLDPGESDLRALSSGRRPASAAQGTLAADTSPVQAWLVALALTALLADWWVLGRAREPARVAVGG